MQNSHTQREASLQRAQHLVTTAKHAAHQCRALQQYLHKNRELIAQGNARRLETNRRCELVLMETEIGIYADLMDFEEALRALQEIKV